MTQPVMQKESRQKPADGKLVHSDRFSSPESADDIRFWTQQVDFIDRYKEARIRNYVSLALVPGPVPSQSPELVDQLRVFALFDIPAGIFEQYSKDSPLFREFQCRFDGSAVYCGPETRQACNYKARPHEERLSLAMQRAIGTLKSPRAGVVSAVWSSRRWTVSVGGEVAFVIRSTEEERFPDSCVSLRVADGDTVNAGDPLIRITRTIEVGVMLSKVRPARYVLDPMVERREAAEGRINRLQLANAMCWNMSRVACREQCRMEAGEFAWNPYLIGWDSVGASVDQAQSWAPLPVLAADRARLRKSFESDLGNSLPDRVKFGILEAEEANGFFGTWAELQETQKERVPELCEKWLSSRHVQGAVVDDSDLLLLPAELADGLGDGLVGFGSFDMRPCSKYRVPDGPLAGVYLLPPIAQSSPRAFQFKLGRMFIDITPSGKLTPRAK